MYVCVCATAVGPRWVPQINHLHTLLASAGTWGVEVEERLGGGGVCKGKWDVEKGIKDRNVERQRKNTTGVFIHTNDKKEKKVCILKQKPDCLCKNHITQIEWSSPFYLRPWPRHMLRTLRNYIQRWLCTKQQALWISHVVSSNSSISEVAPCTHEPYSYCYCLCMSRKEVVGWQIVGSWSHWG